MKLGNSLPMGIAERKTSLDVKWDSICLWEGFDEMVAQNNKEPD